MIPFSAAHSRCARASNRGRFARCDISPGARSGSLLAWQSRLALLALIGRPTLMQASILLSNYAGTLRADTDEDAPPAPICKAYWGSCFDSSRLQTFGSQKRQSRRYLLLLKLRGLS